MNPIYTTHLICAPELDTLTKVKTIHVQSAQPVETDALLIQLQMSDTLLDIRAPEAGTVGEIVITEHENVNSHDLLLTMEIAETEFSFFALPDQEPAFAPACLLPFKPAPVTTESAPQALRILPDAARLAARLGVDLAEVTPGPEGVVNEEAIENYIRKTLLRWRKVRALLSD